MPIRFQVDSERRLKTVEFVDQILDQEFRDYSATLAVDHHLSYDVVFVDLSQMTSCDFGYEQIRPHVNKSLQREPTSEGFVEIIWAPKDVAFGLSRMYELLVGDHFKVKVFRNEHEARDALARTLEATLHHD